MIRYTERGGGGNDIIAADVGWGTVAIVAVVDLVAFSDLAWVLLVLLHDVVVGVGIAFDLRRHILLADPVLDLQDHPASPSSVDSVEPVAFASDGTGPESFAAGVLLGLLVVVLLGSKRAEPFDAVAVAFVVVGPAVDLLVVVADPFGVVPFQVGPFQVVVEPFDVVVAFVVVVVASSGSYRIHLVVVVGRSLAVAAVSAVAVAVEPFVVAVVGYTAAAAEIPEDSVGHRGIHLHHHTIRHSVPFVGLLAVGAGLVDLVGLLQTLVVPGPVAFGIGQSLLGSVGLDTAVGSDILVVLGLVAFVGTVGLGVLRQSALARVDPSPIVVAADRNLVA